MTKRTRLGIITAIMLISVAAIAGAYSLTGSDGGDDDAPNLLGLRLAKPAFAQTENPFPDPDIGISAYAHLDPTAVNLSSLEALVEDLFVGLKFVGDNYRVGWFQEGRFGQAGGSWSIELFLYADTDGWIMAYLRPDRLASELLMSRTDVSYSSVLAAAVARAATVMGAVVDDADVSYYDWRFPQATDLVLARRDIPGNLYLAVPQGSTLHDLSLAVICATGTWSYWFAPGDIATAIQCGVVSVNTNYFVTFPMLLSLPTGRKTTSVGFSSGSILHPLTADPETGVVHTFNILAPTNSGFALVYSRPQPAP